MTSPFALSTGKLRLFPSLNTFDVVWVQRFVFSAIWKRKLLTFATQNNSLDAKERSKNCFKVSLTSPNSQFTGGKRVGIEISVAFSVGSELLNFNSVS